MWPRYQRRGRPQQMMAISLPRCSTRPLFSSPSCFCPILVLGVHLLCSIPACKSPFAGLRSDRSASRAAGLIGPHPLVGSPPHFSAVARGRPRAERRQSNCPALRPCPDWPALHPLDHVVVAEGCPKLSRTSLPLRHDACLETTMSNVAKETSGELTVGAMSLVIRGVASTAGGTPCPEPAHFPRLRCSDHGCAVLESRDISSTPRQCGGRVGGCARP